MEHQRKWHSIFSQLIIILLLSIICQPSVSAIYEWPLLPSEKMLIENEIHSFRSQVPHPCSFFSENSSVSFETNNYNINSIQDLANDFASSPNQVMNSPNSLPFPRYAVGNIINDGRPAYILNELFFANYCSELMDISLSASDIIINMARSWNSIDKKTYWILKARKDTIFNSGLFSQQFGREFARGWMLVNNPKMRIGKIYRPDISYQYNERYQSRQPATTLSFAKQLNPKNGSNHLVTNTYNTVTQLSTGLYRVTFPNFAMTTHFNENTGEKTISPAGVVHVTAVEGNHHCKVYEQRASGKILQLGVACLTPDGAYTNGKFSVLAYKDGVKWGANGKKIKRYGTSYVLANQPERQTSYKTIGKFQYNSRTYQFPYLSLTEGFHIPNTIIRLTKGQYKVTLPNMKRDNLEAEKGGTLLVTAYGYGALRCKAKEWRTTGTDVLAHVLCYNSNGELADSKFALSFMREAGTLAIRNSGDKKEAFYVWGGKTPIQKHSFFQSDAYGESSATSNELARGVYQVQLPGVKAQKTSNVQVTAYGSDSSYCNVGYWKKNDAIDGTEVEVTCFDSDGLPIASNFSLQYFTDSDLR